jgi:hypothetical protein
MSRGRSGPRVSGRRRSHAANTAAAPALPRTTRVRIHASRQGHGPGRRTRAALWGNVQDLSHADCSASRRRTSEAATTASDVGAFPVRALMSDEGVRPRGRTRRDELRLRSDGRIEPSPARRCPTRKHPLPPLNSRVGRRSPLVTAPRNQAGWTRFRAPRLPPATGMAFAGEERRNRATCTRLLICGLLMTLSAVCVTASIRF